jgi:hypothetical protein
MGDRCNIVVKENKHQIWLYGHWSGETYIQTVRDVLARGDRLDDRPYFTRILFCQFVHGNEEHETGFGIDDCIGDNEHEIIVVDLGVQKVYFVNEHELVDLRIPDDMPDLRQVWTLQEFAALSDKELPKR